MIVNKLNAETAGNALRNYETFYICEDFETAMQQTKKCMMRTICLFCNLKLVSHVSEEEECYQFARYPLRCGHLYEG